MLQLIRQKTTDTAIVGSLYLNGALVCRTMENKRTAIPCGKYTIENSLSPKFKRELPLLYNYDVEPKRGIRIHCGTDSSSSSGCILVAMSIVGEKLKESKMAENMVVALCRNSSILTIVEM